MTQKETSDVLAAAAKAVEESSVPDDLRAAAFKAAVEMLLSRTTPDHLLAGATRPTPSDDGPLSRIAATLRLDQALVEDVYFEDGDRLGIGIAASKLDTTMSGGTRQLALLVAAGRQAGGYDEWTASAEIRRVCDEYGRYDSANFASALLELRDVLQIRGSRQQREVRVKRPGFEQTCDLINRLAGESST